MNKIVVGAVGVALVAGAVVGGAAWSGQATQKRLEAETARLETMLPFKVKQAQYDKKLFSATYTVVLSPGCEGEDGPSVTLVHHIKHGPLAGGRPGWAVVDTELLMPDAVKEGLKDLPAGQPLVQAHTVMGLTGGMESRITVPALVHEEQQFKFQALVLSLRGQAKGAVSYELVWPGLTSTQVVPSGSMQIQVGALRVQGESMLDPDMPWMFAAGQAGHGSWELERLDVATQPTDGSKPVHALFTGLRGKGDAKRDKDLLSSVSQFQAQGEVNGVKVANIDMQASLKRVHAPSYAELAKQSQAMYVRILQQAMCSSEEIDPMDNAEASMAALTALLPYDPEMSLDKLSMEVDGQAGELSYQMGTQGVTADDAASPDLRTVLFSKAYANGQAKLPMAWIEKLVIDATPERQTQDRAMFDAMLSQVIDSGYVIREGDVLRSEFKLDKGQLLVNGKAIGPQFGAPAAR